MLVCISGYVEINRMHIHRRFSIWYNLNKRTSSGQSNLRMINTRKCIIIYWSVITHNWMTTPIYCIVKSTMRFHSEICNESSIRKMDHFLKHFIVQRTAFASLTERAGSPRLGKWPFKDTSRASIHASEGKIVSVLEFYPVRKFGKL